MSFNSGGVTLTGQFDLKSKQPIDGRYVIVSKAELIALLTTALYPGLEFTLTLSAEAAGTTEVTLTAADSATYAGTYKIGTYKVKPDGQTVIRIYDENNNTLDPDGQTVVAKVSNKVTVYEVSDNKTVNTIPNGINEGDIAIIKTQISDEPLKVSHSCYVWTGSVWAAADCNYNADNVFFSDNIAITTNFGNYAGSKTALGSIPCKGKSLAEVLESAFGGDDSTVWQTKPSASAAANVSKSSAEVGETITFTYDVTLSTGTYKHGTRAGDSHDLSDKTTGIQYSKVSSSYVSDNLIPNGATLISQTKTVEEGSNIHTFAAQKIYRSAVSKHPCSLKGSDLYNNLEAEYKSEQELDLGSKTNNCTGYRYWYASSSATQASGTCASSNKTTSSEKSLGGVNAGNIISAACRNNKTPRLYTYDDFNKSWELVSGAFSSGIDIFVRPEHKRADNEGQVVYPSSGTAADKYKYYTYIVVSSATYKVTVS